MELREMAGEYRESAALLAERIARLKAEPEPPEDRLLALRTEYYQLLRTASYLEHYYDGEAAAI